MKTIIQALCVLILMAIFLPLAGGLILQCLPVIVCLLVLAILIWAFR